MANELQQIELQVAFVGNEDNLVSDYYTLDIDQTINLSINLQIVDYDNPTANKNNWSNNISIPKSKNNNIIFNHFYRTDYKTNIGYNLNSLVKNRFRLYVDGSIFQTGYFTINEVNDIYQVTLFGELGNFFNSINEVSEIENTDDFKLSNLFFDKKDPFEHTINKEIVANLIGNNENYFITDTVFDCALNQNINLARIPNYTIAGNRTTFPLSILRYSLTYQGLYDNFDNGKITTDVTGLDSSIQDLYWYNPVTQENSIVDELNENQRTQPHIGDSSTSISNIFGEYRSYYQRPLFSFYYVLNKCFEKIKDKLGYNINLDPTFFNFNNPYWLFTYGLCNQYNTTIDDSFNGTASIINTEEPPNGNVFNFNDNNFHTHTITLSNIQGSTSYTSPNISVNIPFKLQAQIRNESAVGQLLNKNNLTISAELRLYENDTLKKNIPLNIIRNNEIINEYVIRLNSNTVEAYRFNRPSIFNINTNNFGDTFGFGYNGVVDNLGIVNKAEIKLTMYGSTWWTSTQGSLIIAGDLRLAELPLRPVVTIIDIEKSSTIRSNSIVRWGDMIENDITIFDFISSYFKLFGLMYDIDIVNKTINILTRRSWYSLINNKVDWSNKVDYSKEFKQLINPYNERFGDFKYISRENTYLKNYNNKYKVDYNSLKYDTSNKTKTGTKNYLDNIIFDNPIIVRDVDRFYLGRDTIKPFYDNKLLPYLADENSNTSGNIMPLFLFGPTLFRTDNLIAITDDLPSMRVSQGFNWLEINDNTVNYYSILEGYNIFDINLKNGSSNYSLGFGINRENYYNLALNISDVEFAYNPKNNIDSTLYSKFWRSFLQDRYNIDSRILSCYVDLNSVDIKDIFRKFIYIDNVVYVVNKINNYRPTSKTTTNVELVKVGNISNYLYQNYANHYLDIIAMYESAITNNDTVQVYYSNPINPPVEKTYFTSFVNTFYIEPTEPVTIGIRSDRSPWYVNMELTSNELIFNTFEGGSYNYGLPYTQQNYTNINISTPNKAGRYDFVITSEDINYPMTIVIGSDTPIPTTGMFNASQFDNNFNK